ncbi:MAG: hypothetical protein J1F65_03875 [Clostridiales bacterium]|nr:hypothetical protein [Clostridiales bacterium]
MKKIKLLSVIIAIVLVISSLFVVLAACDNGPADISEIIEDGQKMTTAELIAKAKEEKGEFNAYGNTSRIAAAMTGFLAKYGEELGLDSSTAHASKQSDSQIYTLLTNEYISSNNSKAASMVMIQDGAQLVLYREQSKILQNYVPSTMKDKVDENDLVPLVHQYINKLFMWNKTGKGADLVVNNVWQVVDDDFMQGRTIYFKSPVNEQVNMNFLIMLTKDEWANKLAAAYKALYNKDIVLDSDCPNAGYQWVKAFVKKASFAINSDTTICEDLNKSDNAGNLGLFVLSKTRDLTTNNLQVAAWKEVENQLVSVNPFAGFMYPMYCQLASNGPRPYTAMLFINYLMEEDGFEPWAEWGAYSTNPDIAIQQGDRELSFWRNTLVIEDASYISNKKASVSDFVSGVIASK